MAEPNAAIMKRTRLAHRLHLFFQPRRFAAVGQGEDTRRSGGVPVFHGLDPRYKRMLWTVIGLTRRCS